MMLEERGSLDFCLILLVDNGINKIKNCAKKRMTFLWDVLFCYTLL